jgi:hypothetical protein
MTDERRSLPITVPPAIQAERDRQVAVEGWTPAHDDHHRDGSLHAAAMIYFHHATKPEEMIYDRRGRGKKSSRVPMGWPWGPQWWKPKDPRRDLERAGALCLAEIDRLKRCMPRQYSTRYVEHKLARIVAAYEALPS